MQSAELTIRQPQDGFVVINDCAFRDAEIGSIRVSAKGDLARANRGKFFDGVYYCYIRFGLIFENAQLRRAILSHGSVTIEMVRSEIEPDADGRVKSAGRFQLERAHFHREHIESLLFARDLGKRFADVPAGDRSLAAGIH